HGPRYRGACRLGRQDYFFSRRQSRRGKHVMLRLLQTLSWRHVQRHRLRTLLTFLGITLGVGVIVAIAVVNRSLTGSFQSTIEQIAGKAVLQVSNGESGIIETAFPVI